MVRKHYARTELGTEYMSIYILGEAATRRVFGIEEHRHDTIHYSSTVHGRTD